MYKLFQNICTIVCYSALYCKYKYLEFYFCLLSLLKGIISIQYMI